MARRLTEVEKIARDICWAGFSIWRPDKTKATYWNDILPEARARYVSDASHVIWVVRRLGVKRFQRPAPGIGER